MPKTRPPYTAGNTIAETFFATLQTELLDRHSWSTRDGLRVATCEFFEVVHNRRRRHKHLWQTSPYAFEKWWYEQQVQAVIASPQPFAEVWSLPYRRPAITQRASAEDRPRACQAVPATVRRSRGAARTSRRPCDV